MMKDFLLLWGSLLFHGFPASLRKNKTSVKEQLFSDCKRVLLFCALALSLSYYLSLPHPSDSPAAYLGLMKDAL